MQVSDIQLVELSREVYYGMRTCVQSIWKGPEPIMLKTRKPEWLDVINQ